MTRPTRTLHAAVAPKQRPADATGALALRGRNDGAGALMNAALSGGPGSAAEEE